MSLHINYKNLHHGSTTITTIRPFTHGHKIAGNIMKVWCFCLLGCFYCNQLVGDCEAMFNIWFQPKSKLLPLAFVMPYCFFTISKYNKERQPLR